MSKLQTLDVALSIEDRKQINEKFSYLAATGELLKVFTKDEVFNYFTGKGGLSGVEFKGFSHFTEYTRAKQAEEFGAFFTPDRLFESIHNQIKIKPTHLVADLTFGKGGFFNGLNDINCYGCEFDSLSHTIATQLFPRATLTKGDLKYYDNGGVHFDVVFGNPPFNLRWEFEKEMQDSQAVYVKQTYKALKENGLFVLLVPRYFMIDEMIHKGIREFVDERFQLFCQYELPANTFKLTGVENFRTKLMFFRKRTLEKGETHSNCYDYFIPAVTTKEEEDLFFHSYIKPIYDELDSAKSKLLNNSNNQSKYSFEAKITKLLFDIKRNPKTSEFYGKCNAYYYKYQTQKKPDDMDDKTWEKTRITIPKLVKYLKQHLQKQNPKKFVPKGTIVKTKYAIKEAKVSMSSRDIFRLVYADEYYFEDRKYAKLIQRKNKEMLNQMQDFDTMQLDDKITTFLKSVALKGFDNGVEVDIALNDIQLEDTNKILQKRYGYLQWEQGAGKTVSGLAQIKYRMEIQGVKKTIIVGPSIAINGTWIDMLRINKLKNLNISSMKDVYEMMSDDYDTVTMSFFYLSKYQKQIKKALKGKKYFFLLDEADSFSNPSSQRTKSGLDLFRRATYKTLMSGTSIRNNIAEFYPQLELLYNNSYNMVDECRFVYKQDQKTKDIVSDINKSQDYPFAPYKKGFTEFKSCFNPSKVSVFGVNKQDQNVYNSESLADILSYTVITRTFEEVTGKKIYKVSPMHIEANDDELQLQETIKKELYSFYGVYIHSTGNSRKDAMLRLLHQMNLLFESCSNPKSFREYKNETFSKWETVKEYLNSNQDHAVIAGVHKSEMYRYRALIQMTYPEKTIFYIDGEVSIKKRKEIIALMGQTKNSVLVCTQQSLSSSISINFIDTVLLTSLDWNLSKMSQFYFRFIRYNSKGFKNVQLLTLKGSIESNLLKVVLDKDNLVNYMKTRKMSNGNKMEVDIDFLLSLMVSKDELSEKEAA